jgi:hypothetical protein
MLYFLHIPKTAGTTTFHLVRQRFQDEELAVTYAGELSFDHPDALFIDRLRAEGSPVRAVYGHYSFGAHLLLGDAAPRYVTFVRHPVSRIQSFFSHQSREPESRLFAEIQKGLTLREAIVQHRAPELNNYMTRVLSIELDLIRPFIDIPRTGEADLIARVMGFSTGLAHSKRGPFDQILNAIHLAVAISNVQRFFCFVGISERMDESLQRLSRGLGWSGPAIDPRFENASSSPHPALDDGTLEVIAHYNQLDLALYERFSESWFERFDAAPAAGGLFGRLR